MEPRYPYFLEPYAGSGLEGLMDAPSIEAAFASPSGIGHRRGGRSTLARQVGPSAIRRIQRGWSRTPHRPLPGRLRRPRHHRNGWRVSTPDGIASYPGVALTSAGLVHPHKTLTGALTRTPLGPYPGSGAGADRGYQNGVSGDARLSATGAVWSNLGGGRLVPSAIPQPCCQGL